MNEQGKIYSLLPRQNLSTQPISEIVPETPRAGCLELDGWIIEILGDTVIVKCAGAVTTSTRTGQLGHVIVRRDPPMNSSRATELVR